MNNSLTFSTEADQEVLIDRDRQYRWKIYRKPYITKKKGTETLQDQ